MANLRGLERTFDKRLYQRQIDALVYALYGLTQEEIVEGS